MRKNYKIEDLHHYAKLHNGECLSLIYINSHSKYTFKDHLGNIFSSKWYSMVQRNSWSPFLMYERSAKKLTTTKIEDLKNYALSKGGECIDSIYYNQKYQYSWKDSLGREFKMSWGDVKHKGQWSPHEKSDKLKQIKTKYSLSIIKDYALSKGGQCLSTNYTRLDDDYLWLDRNGVEFIRSWSSVLRVDDLLYNKGGSYGETELVDFIYSLGLTVIRNDRRILAGLELDILIPELSIAIEYNGCRWHCEQSGKDKNYHLNKMLKCKEQNISLIHIFDHEWINRKEQVKSFLRSKLGKNTMRVFARKTEIKEVSKQEAKEFLNKYHIQGSTNTIKSIGLYDNEELLSLISISKHHRGTGEIVLSRFVGKENITTVGGLSKLVKAAKLEFSSLVTWVDLRWSTGDAWIASGWKLEYIGKPDYFYYNLDNREVKSKQSRKKSSLGTPDGVTEAQHAIKDGFSRVWDCGKLKLSI